MTDDDVERRELGAGDTDCRQLAIDRRSQRRVRLAEQEGDMPVGTPEALADLELSSHDM